MRVLAITAAPPYPPTGGDRLRAHHLVAGLLEAGHHVTVVVLPPDPDGIVPDRPGLTLLGAATHRREGWRRLSALVSPYPEALWARPPSVLREINSSLLKSEVVIALGIAGSRPALHLHDAGIPTVLDEFSVEFRLERDIAATAPTAGGRLRGVIDSAKTRIFETRALRRCQLVTAVSAEDARVLRSLAPHATVEVHPSGADVARVPMVDHRKNRRNRLVLTGTLGYLPNVDAARHLGADILPIVRASRPMVTAQLVGRANDAVRTMIASDAVEVVGQVPDVLPYLADADIFVAPIRVGGGTRLKVLEAFAAGLPVVATSKAVEGLEVESGVHVLVADDAPAFAAAILTLLEDENLRERMALAGRRLAEERYDWRPIGSRFARSVERVAAAHVVGRMSP